MANQKKATGQYYGFPAVLSVYYAVQGGSIGFVSVNEIQEALPFKRQLLTNVPAALFITQYKVSGVCKVTIQI